MKKRKRARTPTEIMYDIIRKDIMSEPEAQRPYALLVRLFGIHSQLWSIGKLLYELQEQRDRRPKLKVIDLEKVRKARARARR
jgi:hypothetical protein